MQWGAKKMKAQGCVIVPVFVATLLNHLASLMMPFTEALLWIKNLVYFHLMARYRYHLEARIKYMENLLEWFHYRKDVFSRFHDNKSKKMVSEALIMHRTLDNQEEQQHDPTCKNHFAVAKGRRVDEDNMQIELEIEQQLVDKSDINILNMHHLNYSSDHIGQLGNLFNASSELPARVMMDLEQAYQQSNQDEASFHTFQKNARKVVFQYQELNANAGKQLCDNEMPLTKGPNKQVMKNLWPETHTVDDLAEWWAMPNGELKNHIAWGFKRFANFRDVIDDNLYFSRLNDAKCTRYHKVAIRVMCFQRDKQVVHMVHCTGSTRWRKPKPQSIDTVLLWMGMSQDRHLKSTAGRILACLKCLFIVEDSESTIKAQLALVQTFATGPICRTAGMVIVEERQSTSNGSLAWWKLPL